jgi:non-specific serine/threonine protein kinase
VRIGEAGGNRLGADSLLDFNVSVSLEGEPLTGAELKAILQSTGGLVLLKGKWVEVDRDQLQEVLNHWQQVQSATGRGGMTLLEGLRLLSGFDGGQANEPETESARAEWSSVVAGEALRRVLDEMQQPGTSAESNPAPDLRAELRPYQKQGAHWLWFMNRLGLGACLADDMGLGKTIQVLSLLLVLKRNGANRQPGLLIVPASLIANWKAEIQKFAPSLSVLYAHPAEASAEDLAGTSNAPGMALACRDLVITSYSMARTFDKCNMNGYMLGCERVVDLPWPCMCWLCSLTKTARR